jgi:hypothetical protein
MIQKIWTEKELQTVQEVLPSYVDEVQRLIDHKSVDVLDAIIHVASVYSVDPEVVASIVRKNPRLRYQLQEQATALHCLKPDGRKTRSAKNRGGRPRKDQ